MNCFRSANVMHNTAIINILNSDNSNVANINTQHCQMMTTIANRDLIFKPMIKVPIVANHTFFTIITFSRINSFNSITFNRSIPSILSIKSIKSILSKCSIYKIHLSDSKICHQDNLPFLCL